jgi:hypothetical protein
MRTQEYDANGDAYVTQAPFRAYKSVLDSVTDHSQLFLRGSRYRAAREATGDPDEFARRIAAAGYNAAPAYFLQADRPDGEVRRLSLRPVPLNLVGDRTVHGVARPVASQVTASTTPPVGATAILWDR